jgi:hypothetical protein
MRLRTLALGLALALASVAPAAAQRGAFAGNWELLGEERVGIGNDRDVITLRHDERFYRDKAYARLRFQAEGGEVRLRAVTLVYLNGHRENLEINQNIGPGQHVDVDLRGERSYLRAIEMFYKGKFGISLGGGGLRVNQASMRVLGENVRAGGPPSRPEPPRGRPAPIAGWQELDVQRFDRREDRVVMPVGRREGAVSAIVLRSDGDELQINDMRIVFGNGQSQTVRINQRLGYGEQTRPIDLEGDRRFIREVTVNLDGRRRSGPAILALFGKDDPRGGPGYGGGGGRRDWVPLGQTEVGFRVDRDVIRVGQSEDWFRNRGFDRLHFVAENNDVHMMSVRVVYMNGYAEDYQLDRLIRAGSDLALDLRGRRSYIREIEMLYRKRPGFPGRAVVRVFGEAPRGR